MKSRQYLALTVPILLALGACAGTASVNDQASSKHCTPVTNDTLVKVCGDDGRNALAKMARSGTCRFVVFTRLTYSDFQQTLEPMVSSMIKNFGHCGNTGNVTVTHKADDLKRGCNQLAKDDPSTGIISFEGCPS